MEKREWNSTLLSYNLALGICKFFPSNSVTKGSRVSTGDCCKSSRTTDVPKSLFKMVDDEGGALASHMDGNNLSIQTSKRPFCNRCK